MNDRQDDTRRTATPSRPIPVPLLQALARQYPVDGPGPRLTLLVLVENMGVVDLTDDGGPWWYECQAGRHRLSSETLQDERTVRRHLAAFESAGIIERVQQTTGTGGTGRTKYVMHPANITVLRGGVGVVPTPLGTPEALKSSQAQEPSQTSAAPTPPGRGAHLPPPAPVRRGAVEEGKLTKAERDAIWDAVAAACGGEWAGKLVGASRGRMASGVADIIKLGCRTPGEVEKRASVYRSKYRGMDLTPTALAANWPSLAPADAAAYNPHAYMFDGF